MKTAPDGTILHSAFRRDGSWYRVMNTNWMAGHGGKVVRFVDDFEKRGAKW